MSDDSMPRLLSPAYTRSFQAPRRWMLREVRARDLVGLSLAAVSELLDAPSQGVATYRLDEGLIKTSVSALAHVVFRPVTAKSNSACGRGIREAVFPRCIDGDFHHSVIEMRLANNGETILSISRSPSINSSRPSTTVSSEPRCENHWKADAATGTRRLSWQ